MAVQGAIASQLRTAVLLDEAKGFLYTLIRFYKIYLKNLWNLRGKNIFSVGHASATSNRDILLL